MAMQVDASVSKVYRIWANRINYNEWFDLIGQVCTLATTILSSCLFVPYGQSFLQEHRF
jgi:hypothetical protein